MTRRPSSSAVAADAKARRIQQLSVRADQAEADGDLLSTVRLREAILRLTPDWTGTAFAAGHAHQLAGKQAQDRDDLQAAALHWRRAEAHYRRELQNNPRCAVTHNNLGNLRAHEADRLAHVDPAAAVPAWQDAIALHRRATQLDPRDALAAANLGSNLSALATLLADADLPAARRCWAQAHKALSRALLLDPGNAITAEWAGNALAEESRVMADHEPHTALTLRTAALERHVLVLRLAPDNPSAAIDCGNDLQHIAEMTFTRDRRAARRLWNEARRHYRQALRLDPTLDIAEHDIGYSCFSEASAWAAIRPKRALTLLAEAEVHYARALALVPDAHDTECALGDTLALRAQLLAVTDLQAARRFWRRATRGLMQVQRNKPDDRLATVLLARIAVAEADALAPGDPHSALRLRRLASRRYRSLLRLPLPISSARECYAFAQQLCDGAEAELNPRAARSRAFWRRAADGFLEAARRDAGQAWAWSDAAYALACLASTWRDTGAAEPSALRAEVIRCCHQALHVDPSHYAAHSQLGCICAIEAGLARDSAADWRRIDDLWQQAIAHHQKALALRRDKTFSLLSLAQVHADQADMRALHDVAAAADARTIARAYLDEARRTPEADPDAVAAARALIELRFAGANARSDLRPRARQRVARRLLLRLDRRTAGHTAGRSAAPLVLARAAAEGAIGDTEACLASLELAVLLGVLTDAEEIDRHPAFDPVREDTRYRNWRRLRFGALLRQRG